MTYNAASKDEVNEIVFEEKTTSEEVVSKFGLVMKIDGKGHVADVVVNVPTRVADPEVIAKISAIMSVLAENLLTYVNSQRVEEINVSFNNGMLLIIPEGNEIRVALMTSP